MAALVPDVVEKILITLDVKDLIRCKSVCKLWHSLISSSGFVTAHMNHSYNNDRDNTEFGHRRILMSPRMNHTFKYGFYNFSYIIGSSNGLVCISNSTYDLFVANPSTREVKKLQSPQFDDNITTTFGFGYDSSTHDYKVVLAYVNGNNQTCFQVLTLKSNVWKVVGKLKYTFGPQYYKRSAGMLCNGALHWFMKDQNKKSVIVSFDLSKEVFKEIPHPNDTRYTRSCNYLGNIDECLCISSIMYNSYALERSIWMMKNYNELQSWVLLTVKNNDVAHYLVNLPDYIPNMSFYGNDLKHNHHWGYFNSPIFVQSLVSPHVYERREDHNSKKNDKEMSARNKKNTAANELPPTVGSRSVARIIDMKQRKGVEVTEREGEEVTERGGEEVTGIDQFGTTEIDRFGIAHYSEKKKEMVSEKAKKIWSGMQNDAAASSATPAEICLKWLKRIPGHLKGRSAPKKEILANERLRKQVEHERKRAEASEEKVEQLTEMCTTLVQENADIKRKMGYVLDQLAHLTGVQLPQEF